MYCFCMLLCRVPTEIIVIYIVRSIADICCAIVNIKIHVVKLFYICHCCIDNSMQNSM